MDNKFYEINKGINKLIKDNKLIIVEGKKDKISLNRLGITNIRVLKKPLYKEIEEISKTNKEIIILTDLDKEGKKLYGKLNSRLQDFGVKIDNSFRELLFKNSKLSHIEGLYSYLCNKEFINNKNII
jgi:5S rRNA maturation endonuclease (ribonuclease M5)